MTSEQLHQWYEQFRTLLWNEAQIDLNAPGDLGRIRAAFISNRDENSPGLFDYELRYAYIPRNGKDYIDPPEEETNEWKLSHMRPERSDEEIQELYDFAKEGALLVTKPGTQSMHQVYIDHKGNLRVSIPADQVVEREERLAKPTLPQVRAPEPIPQPPQQPERTGPTERPGFFSRFIHTITFGLANNDYTKYLRNQRRQEEYQRDLAAYQERMANFDMVAHQEETARYEREMTAYREAKTAYDAQCRDAMLAVIWQDTRTPPRGVDTDTYLEQMQQEQDFWENQHQKTPREAAQKQADSVQTALDGYDRTAEAVQQLLGPKLQDPEWMLKSECYKKGDVNGHDYQLAEKSAFDERSAAMVCFAALADPEVTGSFYPTKGLTAEETRSRHYTHLVDDVLCQGRPASGAYMPIFGAARKKGAEVMAAYDSGDKEPLAKLLACSIRQQNEEVSRSNLAYNAPKISQFTGELLRMLEEKGLLAASGLTQTELETARGNARLSEIKQRSLRAEKTLMEAAASGRQLSPEEQEPLVLDKLQEWAATELLDSSYEAYESTPAYMESLVKATNDYSVAEKASVRSGNKPDLGRTREDRLGPRNDEAHALDAAKYRRNRLISTGPAQPLHLALGRGKDLTSALKLSGTVQKLSHMDTAKLAEQLRGRNADKTITARVVKEVGTFVSDMLKTAKPSAPQRGQVRTTGQSKAVLNKP